MLTLVDLEVRRGPNPVVRSLDLELRPGRVFWIVGPNGAGKSSLLRVMAGLDPPRSGRVVRTAPPGERFLYFESEMALPPRSTVAGWERLVEQLLGPGPASLTPLWPPVDRGRRVGRLSTGERKRLLLDTLLRRAGPLLLDEPYEHLSPEAKVELTRLIEERARSRLVVVATNQLTRRAVADGGLRLEAGVAEPLGDSGTPP